IYIYTLVPEFLWRFVAWLLVGAMYRLEVHGRDKIPDQGACILVCNHVSFMDAVILMGAVRRPTRFVMYWKIFQIPVVKWLFRAARAIPIAGRGENEALMLRAFDVVDRELGAGEVVGIFPEGGITRDGTLQPFRPGIERMLAKRPVPVVPMALRGMWGSLFSRKDRLRLPRRFRSRIALVVGDPIPAGEVTAALLEQRVRELRGDWA
ncbi:MAG: 1-acyl-sn-glycerol-3-phosphate acyltransferase, partial [Pseudomonadota bacterium]